MNHSLPRTSTAWLAVVVLALGLSGSSCSDDESGAEPTDTPQEVDGASDLPSDTPADEEDAPAPDLEPDGVTDLEPDVELDAPDTMADQTTDDAPGDAEGDGLADDASDGGSDAADEVGDASDADDAADADDTTDLSDAAADLPGDGVADLDALDAPDLEPDVAQDPGFDPTTDSTSDPTCKNLGGICVGNQTVCRDNNGTLAPDGDDDCVFDDGAGVCCVPPDGSPTGDTCDDRGGVCAPIAGCNFVDGHLTPLAEDCPFVGFPCCVPEKECGRQNVICCGDTAAFNPACDRGEFICVVDGTEPVPIDECEL